jgi:hypothetical protein
MYKLVFTLKQHTPLIHFQHDQEGATLRATEVKPKLDKFIIEKLLFEQDVCFDFYEHLENGQKSFVNSHEAFKRTALNPKNETQVKWKSWLAGKGDNEHVALDYKLRFDGQFGIKYLVANRLGQKQKDAIGDKFKFIPDTPFFAEEKAIGELFNKHGEIPSLTPDFKERLASIQKIGIFSRDSNGKSVEIKGTIISFNIDLLTIINDKITAFFIDTNFGSRQNKGFGCFSIKSINNTVQPYNIDTLISRPVYKYQNRIDSILEVFKKINLEYKNLRSNAASKQSDLKDYFEEKRGIKWEKDAIYNQVKARVFNKNDFQYIRSILGLADLFEFKHYLPNFKVKVKHLAKNKDEEILRIKSPITFKYFDGYLYLTYNEIPKEIMDQQFEFSFENIEKEKFELKTPRVNENFMDEFLNDKLNKKDWRKLQ